MDEILIDEKKYISSKQAAKITGYAKDYVGQLCREGRVPARLVGRGWYVLESAIHDHRFSDQNKSESKKEIKKETLKKQEQNEDTEAPLSTWESPRYSTSDVETFPSVNRFNAKSTEPQEDKRADDVEIARHLQDTWGAWFDRFENTMESKEPEPIVEEEPEQRVRIERVIHKDPEPEIEKERNIVSIPVNTVRRSEYQAERAGLPMSKGNIIDHNDTQTDRTFVRGTIKVMRFCGVMLATVMVTISILGSGFIDSYIISNSQARALAGIILYNR